MFPIRAPDLFLNKRDYPFSESVVAAGDEPFRVVPEEFMLLNIEAHRRRTFGESLLTTHYVHDGEQRVDIGEQLGVQGHRVDVTIGVDQQDRVDQFLRSHRGLLFQACALWLKIKDRGPDFYAF